MISRGKQDIKLYTLKVQYIYITNQNGKEICQGTNKGWDTFSLSSFYGFSVSFPPELILEKGMFKLIQS